ncbi:MAG: hypothetical protein Q8P72_03005 [Candidatus Roizmanbacteria bacterium]|nr:hypothetical protein [Candidatus Roizmanbacteria bacterium]
MKSIRNIIALSIVFLLFSIPSVAYASDFSMKCDEKKCTPASIARFFDNNVLWYPSYSQVNIVTIQNTGEGMQYVGHRAFNSLLGFNSLMLASFGNMSSRT